MRNVVVYITERIRFKVALTYHFWNLIRSVTDHEILHFPHVLF